MSEEIKYKILEKEFTSKGFKYTQIMREGDFSIYSQLHLKSNCIVGYESIKISRHNGYQIANCYCPPSEVYTSSANWGVLNGLTSKTLEGAYKNLEKMKNHRLQLDNNTLKLEKDNQNTNLAPKNKRGRPKKIK